MYMSLSMDLRKYFMLVSIKRISNLAETTNVTPPTNIKGRNVI